MRLLVNLCLLFAFALGCLYLIAFLTELFGGKNYVPFPYMVGLSAIWAIFTMRHSISALFSIRTEAHLRYKRDSYFANAINTLKVKHPEFSDDDFVEFFKTYKKGLKEEGRYKRL